MMIVYFVYSTILYSRTLFEPLSPVVLILWVPEHVFSKIKVAGAYGALIGAL